MSHLEELPPPKADFSAPPPYEANDTLAGHLNHHQQQQQQQHGHLQHGHGKLPTYEEVQQEKSLHGEHPMMVHHVALPPLPPPPPPLPPQMGGPPNGSGGNGLTFIAIDTSDTDNLTAVDNSHLGTDLMFATAFIIAFLFNWIGFLMLSCFCHTIAVRYGALSGFGLSLAKWTFIVKSSTDLASNDNSWLWWMIVAFGFLICVRALVQYISIKRTWRLLSVAAQERLLFFY